MSFSIRLAGPLARRDGWKADRCTMARSLDVIRTKSAMVVMREAFYGATRFEEFVRRAQLSEPVVAARLRELADDGLLEREDYQEPGQRTRRGYRLTAKGADLFPVLLALMQWGERWLGDEGSGVALHHHACDAPVNAELRCEAGHTVTSGDLDLVVERRPPRPRRTLDAA